MGRSDKLWQYLRDSGVLENGTKEDIERAKREYRKVYEREFRARKRAERHEHTISFDGEEYAVISSEAVRHGLSIPNMVREASLAYFSKRPVVMEPAAIRRIEALLVRILTTVVRIREQEKGWFSRMDKMEEISKVIFETKQEIQRELRSPLLLEEAMRRNLKLAIEILMKLNI